MKMFFNSDIQTTILFSFWETETPLGFFVACCVVFVIGVVSEGLKLLRAYLATKAEAANAPNEETKLNGAPSQEQKAGGFQHLLQTLLHWLQVWVGIVIMLIYMTFNVYLCLAVSLGNALGYFFLFRHSSYLKSFLVFAH